MIMQLWQMHINFINAHFPLHTVDSIHTFLTYYRQEFPAASITVKLHLMEDHMIPFLEKWSVVGFGLLGEQGAESVHKDFNALKARYVNMPNAVERIRCTLQEHHLRCTPQLRDAKPLAKRRKTTAE